MFDHNSSGSTTAFETNDTEPWPPQPAELHPNLTGLLEIARQRSALDHREAVLLANEDTHNECVINHGHRVHNWLADATHIPGGTAASRCRIAERLRGDYRLLAQALAAGTINYHHITAFDNAVNSRNRVDMCDLLEPLIDLAAVATFRRWQQEVRGMAQQLDQDGGYDPASDPSNNRLHLTLLPDGTTEISGRLVGELAFRIRGIIDAETERVLKRHREDANQLATASEHGTGTPGESTNADAPELPSRSQAAAEALCELMERAAGTPDGTGRLPQTELVAHYNLDTQELTDHNGETLSQTMLRFIIAAAMIRPLEMSGTGDPLRMGHALRYANRDQRRALTIRDGGCIFPGCDRPPAWCDAHHVDEWDDRHGGHEPAGPTDIENLALLCRHHHRVTHQPGWAMTAVPGSPDNRFQWVTPTGDTIMSQRHHTKLPPDPPHPG